MTGRLAWIFFLQSFLFVVTSFGREPYRFFTDKNNRTMEARFQAFRGDFVEIQRKDGRSFRVSPKVFSDEDQEYFSKLKLRINPKTNRLWTANDFKSLILKTKWTCNLKPGAYKHILVFEFEKVDLDKDDVPDGMKMTHHTSHVNKFGDARYGTWKVNEDGLLETSRGTWMYDKKSGFLVGSCGYCSSSCCKTLKPHIRQIEK